MRSLTRPFFRRSRLPTRPSARSLALPLVRARTPALSPSRSKRKTSIEQQAECEPMYSVIVDLTATF